MNIEYNKLSASKNTFKVSNKILIDIIHSNIAESLLDKYDKECVVFNGKLLRNIDWKVINKLNYQLTLTEEEIYF